MIVVDVFHSHVFVYRLLLTQMHGTVRSWLAPLILRSVVVKLSYVLEIIGILLEILPMGQTVSSEVFTGRPAFYHLIIKELIMQCYRGTGTLITPTAVPRKKILDLSLSLGASHWSLGGSFGNWTG